MVISGWFGIVFKFILLWLFLVSLYFRIFLWWVCTLFRWTVHELKHGKAAWNFVWEAMGRWCKEKGQFIQDWSPEERSLSDQGRCIEDQWHWCPRSGPRDSFGAQMVARVEQERDTDLQGAKGNGFRGERVVLTLEWGRVASGLHKSEHQWELCPCISSCGQKSHTSSAVNGCPDSELLCIHWPKTETGKKES